MFDRVPSLYLSYPCSRIKNFELTSFHFHLQQSSIRGIFYPYSVQAKNLIKASCNESSLGSDEFEFHHELGLKEKEKRQFCKESEESANGSRGSKERVGLGVESLRFNDDDDQEEVVEDSRSKEDQDLIRVEGSGDISLESEKRNSGWVLRSGRQMIRRSSIIAKQVISVQSALSLGFVSQLWVDTNSWRVLVVEARPNLLFGEFERFLLDDVRQVGDVVLIQDESVVEKEFKMAGLDTLVGYNVSTPSRRNIGKVRGYNFNVNSGALELLELDSFGMSIIPSSVVSTYALFLEDVLDIVSDTVIVQETAPSSMQKLTKGFWDTRNAENNIDTLAEYSDIERRRTSDYGQTKRRKPSKKKFRTMLKEILDEWELPLDYM